MALIKCPECGREVSDKAQACIHCGCPLNDEIDMKSMYNKVCPVCGLEREGSELKCRFCKLEFSKIQNIKLDTSRVYCPRCKSTSITTGARGFSFLSGFIGSNKTVNRCAKCGYTWQPK